MRRNDLQHPAGGVLIEFGSGFSLKTEILLERLLCLGAYVPIDVSQRALADARRQLAARFSSHRHHADRGQLLLSGCSTWLAWRHKAGFFPGSTIENLTPIEASRQLRVFRAVLSSGGRHIVGVDLKKHAAKLVTHSAASLGTRKAERPADRSAKGAAGCDRPGGRPKSSNTFELDCNFASRV